MEWVNTILQGVLLGGLYAMFAAGLSLIFGVMRLVNIAHGDLIVLAAYIALVTTQALGINPILSLVIVVPAMAGTSPAMTVERSAIHLSHSEICRRDFLPRQRTRLAFQRDTAFLQAIDVFGGFQRLHDVLLDDDE